MATARADVCLVTANCGYLVSNYSASYPPTTCSVAVTPATTTYLIGQYIGGSGYQVYTTYMTFDTSVVPDTNIVTIAVLSINITGVACNQTANCYIRADWTNFGTSLTTADYVSPQSFTGSAADRLLYGTGTGWNNVTLTSPRANVNKTGTTQLRIGFYYTSTPYPSAGKSDSISALLDTGDANECYLTVYSTDATNKFDGVAPSSIEKINGVNIQNIAKIDGRSW